MSRPTPAQIEEAATWLLRLRGRRAQRVRDDFDRWLSSDPIHEVAFQHAEAVFGALETPAAVVAERDARRQGGSAFTVLAHDPSLVKRGWQRWAAIAASILVAAGLGLMQFDVVTNLRADDVTAAGETRQLSLPDGSTVTLNTDTAVRYAFDERERRVRLDRGEAFFEVTPDVSRPFIVDTGTAEVQVVGTKFNVRRTNDGAAVSVLEGRVRLTAGDDTDGLVVEAGHAGVIASGRATESSASDVGAALAWREGRAIFYGAPLGEVVEELARYRVAPAVIINGRIRDRTLSGVFNVRRPDAALEIAAKTVDVKIARLPGGAMIVY